MHTQVLSESSIELYISIAPTEGFAEEPMPRATHTRVPNEPRTRAMHTQVPNEPTTRAMHTQVPNEPIIAA